MKTLLTLFTLLFGIVGYGAVPLGLVPYAQLDTNDFGVTAVGHVNTRLSIHTPNTPGDTYYLTINGTNINNGGTNFLQSLNPTAWTLPVRGADTNFVDSLLRQDATGLHMGTNFAAIIDFFGYPALTLGDTGGANTYLTLYPDGLFLKDHFGNALNLYGQTANIGGLIYAKSIMQIGTMWGKVELADDNPAHTAKFQPTLPMGTSHTTLGSSTNAWEGIYAGSTKQFQFFDVVIDPGVSTNLNFAVDGVTYNIGAGGGSVGGTTINPTDDYYPVRLTAGSFGDGQLREIGGTNLLSYGNVKLTNGVLIAIEDGTALNPSFAWNDVNNGYGFFRDVAGNPAVAVASVSVMRFANGGPEIPVNAGYLWSSGTPDVDPVLVGLYEYAGTPETHLSANVGSVALDLNSGYPWAKVTGGSGNTGWTNLTPGSASVTYAAVTNALLATGSASDVLHGDGSWGAGGGGGDTNWTQSAGVITAATNTVTVGDPNGLTNFITAYFLPGSLSMLQIGDGIDSLTLEADAALNNMGTGLYLGLDSLTPFIRRSGGTDITTRTAGDTVTLTGTLTVNDGSGLPNRFGGGNIYSSFYTVTNYTASVTNYSITLGGTCTNTLMSAASVGEGFWLHVKALAGGGEIWVQNGDFMDNVTNLVLAPWSARSFKSDGTNTWEIH